MCIGMEVFVCNSDKKFELVDFSLGDLEFGDIVTLRNEKKYVNIEDYIISNDNYKLCKNCWNNNLKWKTIADRYDIIKIERAGEVIWEREEPEVKEMTIEEISKELGYKVKIVKEKNI